MGPKKNASAKLSGTFELKTNEDRSLLPRGKKACAILAYLSFHCGKPISRSVLIDLFWSDRAQPQGQSSLRQSLHEVRVVFDDYAELLDISRSSITLSKADVDLDLWDRSGAINPALSEPVFEGLDPVSPVFDEWLENIRRSVVAQQLAAAEKELARLDTKGQPKEIERAAQMILTLDPVHEPASQALMEALTAQNLRGQAREEFERITRILNEDGFETDTSTQDLFKRLRTDDSGSVVTKRHAQSGQIPLIGIKEVGFEGENPGLTQLSAIVNGELMHQFSRIPELKTSGRGMNGSEDLSETNYVVEGHLLQTSSFLSLNIRIYSNQNSVVIWSGRERITSKQIERQIAQFVRRVVSSSLPAIERNEAAALTSDGEVTAYQHYLNAKTEFLSAEGRDYIKKVISELEAAIKKRPDFEPAYIHLIQAYNTAGFMSHPGLSVSTEREWATRYAERLLTINARNPNAHIAMAWCQLWQHQFSAAERYVDKAIELQPYEPHRLNALGTALIYLGRFDEGATYYQRADELMPHELDYQRSDYGELYYLRREFDTALKWLEFKERRSPYRTYFWRAAAAAQLGKLKVARASLKAFTEDIGRRWNGSEAFSQEVAVKWYYDLVPLKRESDRDVVRSGFAKLGIAL